MVLNADVVMMGVLTTPTQTAVYASAMTIAVFVNGLAAAFHVAVLPAMSRSISDRASPPRLVGSLLPVILVLTTAAAVGLALLASQIVVFAFGPRYAASAEPLRILAIQLPLSAVGAFYGTYLIVSGRARTFLVVFAAAAAFNICANVVVIPVHGPVGAALSTVATSVLVLTAMVVVSGLGVVWSVADLALAVLAASCVTIVVVAAGTLDLFPRVFLGLAAALPALLLAIRTSLARGAALKRGVLS
jgi:O-antigen/teichoic acid export membrane protein